MIARKKVGYEELIAVKTNEDVEMRDVEMEEVRVGDEDEVAAQVSVLSQLSISACAKKAPQAPRRILQATGPRGRGKFRFQSNISAASDQVHQRVRLHDPDNMADDRRGGGGGYNNRKRRYNRGIRAQKTNTTLDRRADLLLCLQMTMRVVMIADLSAEDTKMLLPVHASVANCLVSPKAP